MRRRNFRTALMVLAVTFASAAVLQAAEIADAAAGENAASARGLSLERGSQTRFAAAPAAESQLPPLAGFQLLDDQDRAAGTAETTVGIADDGDVDGASARLLAVVKPAEPGGAAVLRLESPAAAASPFRFEELDGRTLKILEGDRPVLAYNFGTITNEEVPESDHRRSRGCFIHPLWGVRGEVLTDSFPRDHYHHHGVFWAWPHVEVDGKQYDLWTYNGIEQRLVRWLHRRCGSAAAEIAVENGWFVGEQRVMTERVWIRVWPEADGARAVDLSLFLLPVDKPVKLWGAGGKSYGGMTVRFNVWPRKESAIVTPLGVALYGERSGLEAAGDLANTPLPWASLSSTFPGRESPSGAALFIHPDHPDYPPTWLTRGYGALCVGWPGVEPQTLEPEKPVRLDYRLWIYDAEQGVETLSSAYAAWQAEIRSARLVTSESNGKR